MIQKPIVVLIASLLILSPSIVDAQVESGYIDSLKQLLPKEQRPNTRLKLLTSISEEYLYLEAYEWGKHFAYQAVALARQIESPPSILEDPLRMLAAAFYEQGHTDSLQLVLSELLNLCTASYNTDCLIEYYNTQATLFDLSTHPDSSLFFYQKALEMSEEEPLWQDIILSNMGVIFSSFKLNDRARTYFRKAYDLALSNNDVYIQGLTLLNTGYTFINEKQLDSADYYLAKAIIAANQSGYKDIIAGVHCYMGLSLLERGSLSKADSFLHMALDTYSEVGLEREISETLPYLAQLYYKQGFYDKAKKTALKSIKINKNTESEIYLSEAFLVLADVYRSENNYQLADQYMRTYKSFQDTLQQQTLLNQFSTLEMDYQLAKKEAELQLITTKRAGEKRLQRIALAGAMGLILLLGTIIYLLFHQSKRRRQQNQWLETQVKERTAELNKSNENLKNYLEEMRSFTHITSHDLKEPLRNISSFTGLLERRLKPQLSSETVDFMTQIKNNAYQMHRLIEGILYYSTLDVNENEKATLIDVDLNNLIDEIKNILATTIRESSALIHYSNKLPVINSSPEALQIIIKNLIENGIKYNRSYRPEVTITYEANPKEHRVLIQDNGIGIEPQYQTQVFEMFKRLHNQQEFKGTGMGLAICRKLLRRLGGDIRLQSQEGEGCLFTVILPITNDTAKAEYNQLNNLN